MMTIPYKIFLRIGNIFGVVPWIDFNKNIVVLNIWTWIYPGLLATYIAVYSCFDLNFRNMAAIVLGNSVIFTGIFGTYTNRKHWKSWMKLYRVTNTKIHIKLYQRMEFDYRKSLIFIPFICILILLTLICFALNKITLTLGNQIFTICVRFYLECLAIALLRILSSGFTILNKHFECLSDISITRAEVSFYRSLYQNLFKMTVCFNNLFGWTIALFVIEFISITCIFVNLLIELKHEEEIFFINLPFFIVHLILQTVSSLSLIILYIMTITFRIFVFYWITF